MAELGIHCLIPLVWQKVEIAAKARSFSIVVHMFLLQHTDCKSPLRSLLISGEDCSIIHVAGHCRDFTQWHTTGQPLEKCRCVCTEGVVYMWIPLSFFIFSLSLHAELAACLIIAVIVT